MQSKYDVEALLKTIPKHKGAGINLRESDEHLTLYYQIKDARNTARNIERKNQQEESDVDPTQYWQQVCELGQEILSNKSKDLEIACWLTESWLRFSGFLGLIQGFELLEKLISKYKDKLYPLPDEEGFVTTLSALAGLNGTDNDGSLIQPIRNQYITNSDTHGSYALWQYQQALENSKIKDINILQKKVEAGATVMSMINKSLQDTSAHFYKNLQSDVATALKRFDQLQKTLQQVYDDAQPPSSKIKNILEDFQQHIVFITHDQPYVHELKQAEAVEAPIEPEEAKKIMQDEVKTTEPLTRDMALAELSRISTFFKNTEPHSPLSYAIDRIIRWGNLTLPELMQELIKDTSAKQGFFDLTGLPNSQQS